jgi:cyclophilin family peptidyl-prolyl cis-trans isomerase
MSKKNPVKKQTTRKISNTTIQIIAAVVVVLAIVAIVVANIINQQNKNSKESLSSLVDPTPTAENAPLAEPTTAPLAVRKTYPSEPALQIDVNKKYTATVKMAKGGEFVIQLFPDKAPRTVNSFVFLAREKYFDRTTFHRVLDGFMAQGGDPTGTGMGGPGYEFINEDSDLTFDKPGVVAMANAGRDTNGSQFFITFGPTPQLNGGYTIFGQVISGMEVVNGITRRDPQQYPDYDGDVIDSITINEE